MIFRDGSTLSLKNRVVIGFAPRREDPFRMRWAPGWVGHRGSQGVQSDVNKRICAGGFERIYLGHITRRHFGILAHPASRASVNRMSDKAVHDRSRKHQRRSN